MNAVGMIGGGDAKFAAAMAAYIAWGDWGFVGILFAGLLIITTFVIWTARKTPITNLAPDWKCWSSGRHLPMGVTLGATLILYYLLGAFAQ
jgi:prepilin peptidase CpaA